MSNQPTSYQRHPVEIAPLVFGLVFLGIVAAWGLFELGVVTAADTAWILPVVLIGAGALGVVLALTKPRRAEARQTAAAAYASRWTPTGHSEQTGAPVRRDDDDTLEQAAPTDVRDEHTDTDTDTDTDASTESLPTATQEPRDD